MAKSSRAEMEEHRRDILASAARLLRQKGESAVSVQMIMKDVGLTHGGFYKHFSSKEELMELAAAAAFEDLLDEMKLIRESATDQGRAWERFVADYLSREQIDDRAEGCANTALASDSARADDGSGIRAAYVRGVSSTLAALEQYQARPGSDEARMSRLQTLVVMVGALTLSRATAGTEMSDELSSAASALLLSADRNLMLPNR